MSKFVEQAKRDVEAGDIARRDYLFAMHTYTLACEAGDKALAGESRDRVTASLEAWMDHQWSAWVGIRQEKHGR